MKTDELQKFRVEVTVDDGDYVKLMDEIVGTVEAAAERAVEDNLEYSIDSHLEHNLECWLEDYPTRREIRTIIDDTRSELDDEYLDELWTSISALNAWRNEQITAAEEQHNSLLTNRIKRRLHTVWNFLTTRRTVTRWPFSNKE